MVKFKSIFKVFRIRKRKKKNKKNKIKYTKAGHLSVDVDVTNDVRQPVLYSPRCLEQKLKHDAYTFEITPQQTHAVNSLDVDDDESSVSEIPSSDELVTYNDYNHCNGAGRGLLHQSVHSPIKMIVDQTTECKESSASHQSSCSEKIKRFVQRVDIVTNPLATDSIDLNLSQNNNSFSPMDTQDVGIVDDQKDPEPEPVEMSKIITIQRPRCSMDDWIEKAQQLNVEIQHVNGDTVFSTASEEMINDLVDTITEEIRNDKNLCDQSERVQLLTDHRRNDASLDFINADIKKMHHQNQYSRNSPGCHVVPKCEGIPNPPNSMASTVPETGQNSDEMDDAMQTIIKYTESTLQSVMQKTTNQENVVNQHESPRILSDADIITPRITKLESMVEKVVVTNVTMMENFQRFMNEYNIQPADAVDTPSSPKSYNQKNPQKVKGEDGDTDPLPFAPNPMKRKRSKSLRLGESTESGEQGNRERVGSCDFQRRNQKKYRSDRGPKLTSIDRARKRRAFNQKTKKRFERELKEEIRCMKQLEEMERQIMVQRAQQHMYRARPIKKFKHTEIKLPRRKLKVPKVGIYERALRAKREKEEYLNEFRRLRDMQMGISPRTLQQEEFAAECDMGMRTNGCESRLRVMQSLRLRQ